ncbi:hypothetical protein DXG03_004430, partial [Asterophora parasitica]
PIFWGMLQSKFNAKWPERVAAVKTKEEKMMMLEAATLKPGDIGKQVAVNGVDELSHVAWADKVQKLMGAIHDRNRLLINSTCQALPVAIKSLLGSYSILALFCDAVHILLLERIQEKQEEENEHARVN